MPRTSLSRPPVSRASVVRASQARRVRVACLQISLVPDAARNLAHCLRLIDEAAEDSPALMVLPEMSNWSGGMVRSLEEALQHGCTVPGPFTDALAERAERHGCHIAAGLIERQGDEAFITSVILAPDRRIVLKYQKQVIFGGQRVWASSGRCGNPVVDLPFGRVGVYICADGLVPETARMLMLQGAQLLLNTLHSGGSDETHLHVPARAVENRVWVASANKVGPRDLGGVGYYCGGSQIVSPDGVVAARADDRSDMVVSALIDLSQADDKRLCHQVDQVSDDLLQLRRPDCYGALLQAPAKTASVSFTAPLRVATLGVAALQPRGRGEAALRQVLQQWRKAVSAGAGLVVLPELFAWTPDEIAADPAAAADYAGHCLRALCGMARDTASWGICSLIETRPAGAKGSEAKGSETAGFQHSAVLIDHRGEVIARYAQVHVPKALASWAGPGDVLPVFDTPIGRIGMLCGVDAVLPESFRVLAAKGAALVAVCGSWYNAHEIDLQLPERVAENRINVVLARRADAPVQRGSAIVAALPYPSEPHWKLRSPDVVEAALDADFVLAGVNLAATIDKTVAPHGCDLFASAAHAAYALLTDTATRDC